MLDDDLLDDDLLDDDLLDDLGDAFDGGTTTDSLWTSGNAMPASESSNSYKYFKYTCLRRKEADVSFFE